MTIQHALVVDVGNTRAKFGLFETGGAMAPQVRSNTAVRLANASVVDEFLNWVKTVEVEISSAVVAGSNPGVRNQLVAQWPGYLVNPSVIDSVDDVPIDIDVDLPHSVGIDRLLTALAAHQIFANRQPIIVVDSGTATTVNFVTSDGVFRGGAILPGIRLAARSLHDYTARLPLLDTDKIAERVNETNVPVIGRTTEQAITSGLLWGQLGAITEIRKRFSRFAKTHFNEAAEPVCLVTGGGGRQLADHLTPCVYIDSLALHGLAFLACRTH